MAWGGVAPTLRCSPTCGAILCHPRRGPLQRGQPQPDSSRSPHLIRSRFARDLRWQARPPASSGRSVEKPVWANHRTPFASGPA